MKQVLVVLSLLALAAAEVAFITKCDDVPDETICQISEVRITPCNRGKANKKLCPIKKGRNTTLSFDFTPNFSATSLKTMVYYPTGGSDLKFDGLGSDNACDYTTCPTVQGSPQQFNYNLLIERRIPKGIFPLKWKVWDEDNVSQVCCFQTTIDIKK